MDHLTEPLEALRARALAWLHDGRARVLAAAVDPELGEGARALIASLEWAPDNARPFFVLGHDGWAARAEELRGLYQARRDAFAGEGVALPALAAPPAGTEALAAFAWTLTAVARAFDGAAIGARGLAVVLAPEPPAEARALVTSARPGAGPLDLAGDRARRCGRRAGERRPHGVGGAVPDRPRGAAARG
jgi:hypothetical protein